ncbi:MAG: family 10 glycosylhydrolase [Gemmataceae bacterium]
MRHLLALVVLIALGLVPVIAADDPPPLPKREFRAAWVATVGNIDWPSRRGLSVQDQQDEMRAILDKCVAVKLNAIVLQVRTMCDALYASPLEPWSEFLTGTPGQAPEPAYDPLEFAVREAHARGLELHAWLNPYRAKTPGSKPAAADHLVAKRPDLAKVYGKYHWLNPTHPDVQKHSLAVFLDVVRRYDIDGIHMDDYFYPYPDYGDGQPFPDDDTWEAYKKAGGTLDRDDWRRDAVNKFVERLYKDTKAAKPWVKVGISPFGIWRPGNPPGIQGFDQYAKLYADAKLWLNEGWVDYFTPQLYWAIEPEKQSYPKLLAWWAGENTKGRHLWPGNNIGRHPAAEIVEQVKRTRSQVAEPGNVFFSMKTILRNAGGKADALAALYAEPALVPATPWLGKKPAVALKTAWRDRELVVTPQGDPVRQFVVRSKTGGKWAVRFQPADGTKPVAIAFAEPPETVLVSAVDRIGQETEPTAVGR